MSKSVDTLSNALELAIVMPAYNEQECIAATVEAWLGVLKPLGGILVVVNDGSKDATGEILDRLLATNRQLRVIHQRNAGHGAAILRGYQEALAINPRYIFQTDSDNQFSTEDFWKLWNVREDASFISGIRRNRQDPLHRLLISRLLRTQLNVAFGVRVTDANIPFRLMRADFLRLALTAVPASSFAPNIFISILAKRVWNSHREIPIRHLRSLVQNQSG